jgi:hypothetical protein
MNQVLTKTLCVCVCILGVSGTASAQEREDYCGTLKMLVQSAKDGFARAQDFKMAGAATCNLQTDTRSYGCMWTFDKSSWTAAGYQKAVQGAKACFPNVTPKQSRSPRGTLHTEYDFGKGQPLIDISRGKPGSDEGDWYSIDIVAP